MHHSARQGELLLHTTGERPGFSPTEWLEVSELKHLIDAPGFLLGTQPDANGQISVSYTPPKQSTEALANIPQNGRLVRFYFTLRDQRGGLDYTQRALCLVPAADQQ